MIDYKSKIRDRVRYLERSEELMKRKMRDQLYKSNRKAEIDQSKSVEILRKLLVAKRNDEILRTKR